jgi:hypothetical protein
LGAAPCCMLPMGKTGVMLLLMGLLCSGRARRMRLSARPLAGDARRVGMAPLLCGNIGPLGSLGSAGDSSPLHDSLRRLCHAHNRPVFRICLARLVRTGPVSRTGPYAGSCSAGMGSLLPLEESLRMSDAFLLCRGMSWSAIPLRCPPLRSAAHR